MSALPNVNPGRLCRLPFHPRARQNGSFLQGNEPANRARESASTESSQVICCLLETEVCLRLLSECRPSVRINFSDKAFALELCDQAPIGEVFYLELVCLRHRGRELRLSDTHQLRIGD